MKVEIVEADNVRELDRLVNTCIQERHVTDIKLSSVLLQDGKIQYTALIMLES